MRVGLLQTKPKFGQKDENLKSVVEKLRQTDAELIVLPELFDTGYGFDSRKRVFELASPIPEGETIKKLRELSRDKDMAIIAGIAERDGDILYNSAVAITPDGKVEVYRKFHLFYKEKEFFSPGNLPLKIIDFRGAKIGMMICFDWIFPEVARSLSLMGADIICHPANLVLPYCQNAMITRCLENRVFSITCNRIGEEEVGGELYRFTGMSRIISPEGEILAESSKIKEEIIIVDIDFMAAENKRITSMNDLFEDRRPDYYRL